MAQAQVVSDPVVIIEKFRSQVSSIKEEIAALHALDVRLSQADAEQKVREWVAAEAQRMQPPITETIAMRASRLNIQGGIGDVLPLTDKVNALTLLLAIFPGEVEQVLIEALRIEYTGGDVVVLGVDEQRQREAALKDQLFELELAEEKALYSLEKAGRPALPRRADADPRAILDPSTM
jgi:hypothetical protein